MKTMQKPIHSASLNQLAYGLFLLIGLVSISIGAEPDPVLPTSQPFVGERGSHHRVWQRAYQYTTPSGRTNYRTNTAYIELATGLHYQDEATGQWVDSQELIEIVEDGAVARKTPHKVKFLSNLNVVGALDVLTPDGKRLRSRILGLAYSDAVSGKSVLFAQTKDCIGEVALPNQVIYKDAFEGVLAMARYTLTKAGIEQDIVFLENPPSPADFGLDPNTTRLEVWTEFFDPPVPQLTIKVLTAEQDQIKRQAMAEPDFIDTRLDFGQMKIGRGRAFSADEKQAQGKPVKNVVVGKVWGQVDERTFLVEKVRYPQIKEVLDILPKTSALSKEEKDLLMSFKQEKGKIKDFAFLQAPTKENKSSQPMRLTSASKPTKGLVLDFSFLSSATNFTFQGDTTYFVTGPVLLSGNTTIEGGAVIKFTNYYNSYVAIMANVNCVTDPYRPAVFTSKDDDSVGEYIDGSTGTPYTPTYNCALDIESDGQTLSNLRISYADYAVLYPGTSNLYLKNIQMLRNFCGFYFSDEGSLFADNCLFYTNYYTIVCDWILHFSGQHLTVRKGNTFAIAENGSAIDLTNCLIVGLTNWGFAPRTTNCTIKIDNDSGVFQTVGAGGCYLATNSPYRDIGTTNLTPNLLAEIRTKTTYPPIVYENATLTNNLDLEPQALRDTDQPDLGYHYAPLDYLFGGVTLNTNMTVSAGTVLGWYRTSSGWEHAGHGIHLADGMQAVFNGEADAPTYWVRRNLVQESEPITHTYGPGGISSWAASLAQAPTIQARFTRFSMLANDGNHFRDDYGFLIARTTHCEYWGGNVGGYWSDNYYTNCLFDRTVTSLLAGSTNVDLVMRNCTASGGSLSVDRESGVGLGLVRIRDTIFDGTTISPTNDPYSNDTNLTDYAYNAFTSNTNSLYPTNANDKLLTNFNWQVGLLGQFYLPNNSTMINAGSCNATNVGLYHFTTTTNQVKETNSVVDRGYHYVALNGTGHPYDTDGDGIPDYVEDANGNGVADGSESNWLVALDSDGDGVPDFIEILQGRNPFVYGSTNDINGIVNLIIYSPLK